MNKLYCLACRVPHNIDNMLPIYKKQKRDNKESDVLIGYVCKKKLLKKARQIQNANAAKQLRKEK